MDFRSRGAKLVERRQPQRAALCTGLRRRSCGYVQHLQVDQRAVVAAILLRDRARYMRGVDGYRLFEQLAGDERIIGRAFRHHRPPVALNKLHPALMAGGHRHIVDGLARHLHIIAQTLS